MLSSTENLDNLKSNFLRSHVEILLSSTENLDNLKSEAKAEKRQALLSSTENLDNLKSVQDETDLKGRCPALKI